MFSIQRNIHNLKCREFYFCAQTPEPSLGDDVHYIVQGREKARNSVAFHTSIVDLRNERDVIYKAIKKGFSYEIRRAEMKDLIEVNVHDDPSPEVIGKFCQFYDAFAVTKKIRRANRTKLEALKLSSNLVISASFTGSERAWVAVHAYICDGARARLLYSAGKSLHCSPEERQLVGRANKFLHWEMMCFFKENGYTEYDLGGLSKSKALREIDTFKEGFGGREVVEYNAINGVSVKGKVCVALFALSSRLRSGLGTIIQRT